MIIIQSSLSSIPSSASDWLKGPPRAKRQKNPFQDFHPLRFFLNNIPLVVFLVIYFSINIVLFVEAAYRHRAGGTIIYNNSIIINFSL